MIERHHDVAADRLLRFDANLRAEQNRLPIHVTLENRALFAHGAQVRERENLIPAGVSQDGAFPAHEFVNPADAPEHLCSRSQQQVISIREQNLGTGFFERARQLRLYRCRRPHRHEERCLHLVMERPKSRRARTGRRGNLFEAEVQTRGAHRSPYSFSLREQLFEFFSR